jgi:hypothetical protein
MAAGEHPDARSDPALRKRAAILPESEQPRSIVLASVLELSGLRRKRAIATTLASMTHGESVVFVTDDLDFGIFVRQRLYYEFLPPIAAQAMHSHRGPWDQYLVKRLRILIDKWAPARILALGTPFERFVEKARQ